jgi:predicted dehydrogenase
MTSISLRTAVIGVGYLGRFHAQKYAQLEGSNLVAVCDYNAGAAGTVAAEFGVNAVSGYEELFGQVDAVSIAVPTPLHFEVAGAFLRRGVHVLVEKPITTTVEEAQQLIQWAREHQCVLQVGHLERFNPAVRATVPLITTPMFFEVHRLSVFTPRSLDVDVVLDLMIHDLDAVLSFVNSPVKEIRAVGLPILSNKVDIANVRLEFESGCVANLTASRVSTERVRKLRFFQPKQYVSLDYGRQDVIVFSVGDPSTPGTPSANPQIKMFKPPITAEEPLRAEITAFIDAVRSRSTPVVPLEEGRRALKLALDVTSTIERHGNKVLTQML